MNEMTCRHCGATTSNGLALCELCQYAVSKNLEYLPVYFRNLARWRPGRAGSRPVPGSRVLYDGETKGDDGSDRIIRALTLASGDVYGWVRCLVDDRGIEEPFGDDEAQTMNASCRLLAGNVTSIATLEWAGEFVRQVARHELRLSSLTLEVAPGWYAGECKHCRTPTHVVPGLTWVKCGGCGSTTYARDHLDAVLDEAADWVALPKRIAEAIVCLVDDELSVPNLHDRIRQWEHRANKRESTHAYRTYDSDGDPVGPKRYRFGDVLGMVLTKNSTREQDAVASSV